MRPSNKAWILTRESKHSEFETIRDSFYEDHSVYAVASDTSFDDENTFTAYGDISRSEITFVPSALSEVSPQKRDSGYRRNAKRPLPPVLKKNVLLRTMREEKVRQSTIAVSIDVHISIDTSPLGY